MPKRNTVMTRAETTRITVSLPLLSRLSGNSFAYQDGPRLPLSLLFMPSRSLAMGRQADRRRQYTLPNSVYFDSKKTKSEGPRIPNCNLGPGICRPTIEWAESLYNPMNIRICGRNENIRFSPTIQGSDVFELAKGSARKPISK